MPNYLCIGRRRNDIALMVDFHRRRAIVRANTQFIDGVALEKIPPGPNDFRPGMVLISRNWRYVYFLEERDKWSDDDYFELAKRLMWEKGINKP